MDMVSWIVIGGLVVIAVLAVALLKWFGRRSSPIDQLDADGAREVREAQERYKHLKHENDYLGPGGGFG